MAEANTAKMAFEIAGPQLAEVIAARAKGQCEEALRGAETAVEVVLFDRSGVLVARSSDTRFPVRTECD